MPDLDFTCNLGGVSIDSEGVTLVELSPTDALALADYLAERRERIVVAERRRDVAERWKRAHDVVQALLSRGAVIREIGTDYTLSQAVGDRSQLDLLNSLVIKVDDVQFLPPDEHYEYRHGNHRWVYARVREGIYVCAVARIETGLAS